MLDLPRTPKAANLMKFYVDSGDCHKIMAAIVLFTVSRLDHIDVLLKPNITWKPITCLRCGREAPAASEASHASEASGGERSEPSAHGHIRRATNRHIRRAQIDA